MRPNPESQRSQQSDMAEFLGQPLDALSLWELSQLSDEELRGKIEDFQNQMLQRGLKLPTIKRRMATLRSFFQFLHREKIRSKVSDRLVRLEPGFVKAVEKAAAEKRSSSTVPNKGGGEKGDPLEPDVVKQLLEAPDLTTVRGLRDWNIMHLMVHDGLSRRQISTLNVGDFDRDKGHLRVLPLRRSETLNLRLKRSHKATGTSESVQDQEQTQQGEKQQEQASVAEVESDQDSNFVLLHLLPEANKMLGQYLEASDYEEEEDAPLFHSLDNKRARSQSAARRLSQDGLYGIVEFYAKSIGHPEINSRKLQKTAAASIASQLTSPPPTSSKTTSSQPRN